MGRDSSDVPSPFRSAGPKARWQLDFSEGPISHDRESSSACTLSIHTAPKGASGTERNACDEHNPRGSGWQGVLRERAARACAVLLEASVGAARLQDVQWTLGLHWYRTWTRSALIHVYLLRPVSPGTQDRARLPTPGTLGVRGRIWDPARTTYDTRLSARNTRLPWTVTPGGPPSTLSLPRRIARHVRSTRSAERTAMLDPPLPRGQRRPPDTPVRGHS